MNIAVPSLSSCVAPVIHKQSITAHTANIAAPIIRCIVRSRLFSFRVFILFPPCFLSCFMLCFIYRRDLRKLTLKIKKSRAVINPPGQSVILHISILHHPCLRKTFPLQGIPYIAPCYTLHYADKPRRQLRIYPALSACYDILSACPSAFPL